MNLQKPQPSLGLANGTDNSRIAVLGASGYTGEEVIRLMALHPTFTPTVLTGESQAGKVTSEIHAALPYIPPQGYDCTGCTCYLQAFSDVYPHLVTATDVPTLVKIADVNWDDVDAAFCCLPHATTQETLAQLPKHIKIVDLSADFRLRNVDTYAEW